MHTLHHGYRSMSVLFSLNWDRILYVFTVAVALFAGAFLGSFLQ